jgi:hypothetical protein
VQFASRPEAGVKLNKNEWKKLISNEELEFDDLESTEEVGFDVCDWLNADMEYIKYRNLTKEEVTQVDEDSSSKEVEEGEKKEEMCKVQIFRSETKLGIHHKFCRP